MMRAQIADTPELRVAASALITKQYAAKGYGAHQLPESDHAVSIVVLREEVVVGTLTITIDSPAGLLTDLTYGQYVNDRRALGRRCVEITKFAFDARDYRAVDAGFRLAIAIMLARGCTDLFAEVNPKQQDFYEKRLRFWSVGAQAVAERVGAPAVLLWIELDRLVQTIDGRKGPRKERSKTSHG
jgi:hypothetical protein